MKWIAAFALAIFCGCSTTETITTERVIREDVVSVPVPALTAVLPATTMDSLTIVTTPSPIGTVTVRPDTVGKTHQQKQAIKQAVSQIREWNVTVAVQPPNVDYRDTDTTSTTVSILKEATIWEKITDSLPYVLLVILAIVGVVFYIKLKS
jgi:hypothetical protein